MKRVAKSKLVKYIVAVADLNNMDNEIFSVHALTENDALIKLLESHFLGGRIGKDELDYFVNNADITDIGEVVGLYHTKNLLPSFVYNKLDVWLEKAVDTHIQEYKYKVVQ